MAVKDEPYDQGDDVRLSVKFYDAADTLADPASGYLHVLCPDGTLVEFTLVQLVDTVDIGGPHPSVGFYRHIFRVANGWGVYRVTWHGEGAFAINRQDRFNVRKTMEQEAA